MKLSNFNVYSPGFPEPGQTLVHNTLRDSTVVLGDDVLAGLRSMSAADGPLPDGTDELAGLEVGVVVASLADEERAWHAWIDAFRSKGEVLRPLVCVSYACNMACPYCCQDEYMNGQQMKPDTAEKVAAFLLKRLEDRPFQQVELTFVGGEPLVNMPAILTISRRLRDACQRKGIPYKMALLTNAALLDEAREAQLLEVGLSGCQVTVDGDCETHNASRPLRKGGDSFSVVWENVRRLVRKVPVNLTGNFTPETAHSFRLLVERMKREGFGPREFPNVRFKPVLAGLSASPEHTPETCTWSGAGPDLLLSMFDMVRDAGFPTYALDRAGPCAFYDDNHLTIGPGGEIYKCPGFLGVAGWDGGNVASGFDDRWQRFTRARPYRECGSCAHRPECAGGCVASEWLRNGRMEGVNCEREMLETVALVELKRLVRGDRSDSLGSQLETIAQRYAGAPKEAPAPGDEGLIAPKSLARRAA